MDRIALVTDSTSDLTDALIEEYNVHVIPLKVRFREKEYLAGEITSEEFYLRLSENDELPKTSQPSPEDFSQLYQRLLKDYQEVISIHLSSGLSGTLNAANLAKERFKEKIHLVDSKTISLGTGLMVLEAAKNIKEGLGIPQILNRLSNARRNIETLFTLNTLEYLQKGGRIGKVQSLVGSLLNIKPIINVGEDGIYHSYGKARGQLKALENMIKAFQELAHGRKAVRLFVAHGAANEAGIYLKESLEKAFLLKTTIYTQVGPVIGVHTGPGTVGAAIQFE